MNDKFNIYNGYTPEEETPQVSEPAAPAIEPVQPAAPAAGHGQQPAQTEPPIWTQRNAAEDAGQQNQTPPRVETIQTAEQEAAHLVQPVAPPAAPVAAAENSTQPQQLGAAPAGTAPQTSYWQAPGSYQSPYANQAGYYGAGGSQWSRPPAPPQTPGQSAVPGMPPQKGRPKKEGKKKRGWLGAVALVLACAVAGFGGGALANGVFESQLPAAVSDPAQSDGAGSEKTSTEKVTGGGSGGTQNLSVSDIAAKAGSSVVSITTENLVTDQFFSGRVVSGAGSGVIISEDGYIITNNHVIDGARSVKVTLQDGSEYDATVEGADAATDIAVIKIDFTGLVPADISDSDLLQIGDFCLAIGNPMGTLGGTVTDGIISALNRELTIDGNTMNLLQTNAAVSPGNSGGGLFDADGKLIGIVNAKSSSDNSEGLGFAIPANTAMKVAEDLMTKGYVTGRPGLGISVVSITTPQQAQQAQVGELGVYIAQITEGGAAEAAGLQVGDLIASIDGQAISQYSDISAILQEKQVGDSISMQVLRDGKVENFTVVLQELSAQSASSSSVNSQQ